MKFIHLANGLLGFDGRIQQNLSVNMRSEKEKNLVQILKNAKAAQVDGVIVTGSMFLNTPDVLALMQLDAIFSVLGEIPVIYLPGKRDEGEDSLLDRYEWESNVTVIKKGEEKSIRLKHCKATVCAIGCELPVEELLKQKKYHRKKREIRILLLPRMIEDREMLTNLAFDYIGLGQKERMEDGKIYSPGLLQAIGFSEETVHGYFFVDIDRKAREANVHFVAGGAPEFLTLKIHADEINGFEEAKEMLEMAMKQYGKGQLYRISVDGEKAQEILEKESEFLKIPQVVSVMQA